MSEAWRGVLTRIEDAFARAMTKKWEVVAPFFIIAISISFLTNVAVPLLLPKTAILAATVALVIVSIVFSIALTVGTYSEILRPSPALDSFSFDAVSDFFERSFKELRKVLRTYYYVIEYGFLIPFAMLVWAFLVLWIAFGIMGVAFNPSSSGLVSAIGPWIMVMAASFWVLFMIYRQYKSVFSVLHALIAEKNDRETFHESVALTDGKWWKIFWNLFAFWFICGWAMLLAVLALSLITGFLPIPTVVKDFVVAIPGTAIQILSAFFAYELYLDYSKKEGNVGSIFAP